MCIRDSIVDGIDFEGGFSMQGAKLQGYGTKEEPAYLTFYPVSYTHLRAHETVLDLVCRLLLEKKNSTRTLL